MRPSLLTSLEDLNARVTFLCTCMPHWFAVQVRCLYSKKFAIKKLSQNILVRNEAFIVNKVVFIQYNKLNYFLAIPMSMLALSVSLIEINLSIWKNWNHPTLKKNQTFFQREIKWFWNIFENLVSANINVQYDQKNCILTDKGKNVQVVLVLILAACSFLAGKLNYIDWSFDVGNRCVA